MLSSTIRFSVWRFTWEVSVSIFLESPPLVSFILGTEILVHQAHHGLVLETLAAQIGFRQVLARTSTSACEHVNGIECNSVPEDVSPKVCWCVVEAFVGPNLEGRCLFPFTCSSFFPLA